MFFLFYLAASCVNNGVRSNNIIPKMSLFKRILNITIGEKRVIIFLQANLLLKFSTKASITVNSDVI